MATFAASVLQMLADDPRRYRNFGPYWWFVKALLKRFYTREQLMILGDYIDPEAERRMPRKHTGADILPAAIEEYRINAQYKMLDEHFIDDDGEEWTLWDADASI